MGKKDRVSLEDDGFSLVELIVVIVILAILVGVTVGGIYSYVGQARRNTDINNAAVIEKIYSSWILTDDEIISYADEHLPSNNYPDINNGNACFVIRWNEECQVRLVNGGLWFCDLEGNKNSDAGNWGHYNFNSTPNNLSWKVLGIYGVSG